MDITLFTGGLKGGGAERVICNLANYLSCRHNITILTMAETEKYDLNAEITIYSLLSVQENRGKLIKNIKRYFRLKQFIKKNKSDIYIVFLPVTICLFMHFKKFIKSPVVLSERNSPEKYSGLIQFLIKYYSKKADGMVYQTNNIKNWYNLPDKINSIIIPNAINGSLPAIKTDITRKKKIVAVGRLTEQKNFELLIKSFAVISDKVKDYQLIIYGEGTLRTKLEILINKLNLNKNVFLNGFSDNIYEDIKDAALFVLSSDYEGMPNALIEAMALGLPCVSTKCGGGGAEYLIKNGINGMLVPINNIDALSKAILYMLENTSIAYKMGEEAQKIRYTLSHEIIYGKWETFLCDIKGYYDADK